MEYHYVYSITYTDEPNIYYGVRTSRKPPEQDTRYWGSPKAFKEFMDAHKATRVKTILAVYPTREEAELAEDVLIENQWTIAKPLSLNGSVRGAKFNTLGRKNTPEHIEAVRKAVTGRERSAEEFEFTIKPYYLISPNGQIFQGRNLRQFCRDNYLAQSNLIDVIQGKALHSQGWISSLDAHKLYLRYYADRGISWSRSNKLWRVSWSEDGKNIKNFKSKIDAINFRDSLEALGHIFRITAIGWKEQLNSNQQVA